MRHTIERLIAHAAQNPLIAVGLAGLRVVYGLYWLYSAAWKIPLEVGRPGERSLWYWLIQGVQHPTVVPFSTFVLEVVLPNFLLFGTIIFLVELFVGLSLVSGALTRLGTLAGMGMSLVIFLTVGSVPGESPLFYLGLFLINLLLFLTRSGRYYGLDAVLSRHLALFLILAMLSVACQSMPPAASLPPVPDQVLRAANYLDKARGYWFGALIGNYAGLHHKGRQNLLHTARSLTLTPPTTPAPCVTLHLLTADVNYCHVGQGSSRCSSSSKRASRQRRSNVAASRSGDAWG